MTTTLPLPHQLQRAQSDTESSIDAFTNSEEQSQLLCDHMDHVLMHGLREFEDGYWPFVCYFTRNELVQKITRLKRVTTSLGKGKNRTALYLISGLIQDTLSGQF